MALFPLTPQQAKVLQAMRSEGLQVRKILRIFPPLDIGFSQEVLFTAMDGKAGTVWIGADGKIARGPVPGFGDPLDD